MSSSEHQYGNDANFLNKAQSTFNAAAEKITSGASKVSTGPGAEQDRYASYFNYGADGLKRLATAKGSGAEQDRYSAHFGLGPSASEKASDALINGHLMKNAWLGHDGKQRMLHLVSKQGVGAEQDRHDAHFGLGEDRIQRMKEGLSEAGDGIERGFKKATR
jgi:hypothetical protein